MRSTEDILRTYQGTRPVPDDIAVQAMRVVAIGRLIDAAANAFMQRYEKIARGSYSNELIEDDLVFKDGGLISALKKIAKTEIIPHRDIVQLELMGKKVIHDLMDLFWAGASRWNGHISDEPF